MNSTQACAEKTPAQPHALSFRRYSWGALSVPRKNLGLPDVTAAAMAARSASALRMGMQ